MFYNVLQTALQFQPPSQTQCPILQSNGSNTTLYWQIKSWSWNCIL